MWFISGTRCIPLGLPTSCEKVVEQRLISFEKGKMESKSVEYHFNVCCLHPFKPLLLADIYNKEERSWASWQKNGWQENVIRGCWKVSFDRFILWDADADDIEWPKFQGRNLIMILPFRLKLGHQGESAQIKTLSWHLHIKNETFQFIHSFFKGKKSHWVVLPASSRNSVNSLVYLVLFILHLLHQSWCDALWGTAVGSLCCWDILGGL